jgi:5-formyltetrahydrofolate cyclo-ligase
MDSTTADAKRALRKVQRARRAELSEIEAAARSAVLCQRLQPLLGSAQHVALFWPMLARREVDLRALDAQLREQGKAIYYPWMAAQGEDTRCEEAERDLEGVGRDAVGCFRRVSDLGEMVPHRLGFLQPKGNAPAAVNLDAVVVPALAATPDGQRLGYGAGYYDRILAQLGDKAETLTALYDFEVCAALPHEAHDRAVRWVVTDQRCYGPLPALS